MIVKRDQSGNFSAGTITQQLSGNQSTQTKWQTARTLTIGSTGKSVNGESNVSWSLSEIGAQPQQGSTSITTLGTVTTGTWNAGQIQTSSAITSSKAGGALVCSAKGDTKANIISNWSGTGYGGFRFNANPLIEAVIVSDTAGTYSSLANFKAAKVYGAVYNDYQEYRFANEDIMPGLVQCINEQGRLYKCDKDRPRNSIGVVSDAFGFQIGQVENEQMLPIQVAGRVLVYAKGRLRIGDQVCQTKGGVVRKMRLLEKILHPEQIIGFVDEFPTYETWGTDNVSIDGRIWINVRR